MTRIKRDSSHFHVIKHFFFNNFDFVSVVELTTWIVRKPCEYLNFKSLLNQLLGKN